MSRDIDPNNLREPIPLPVAPLELTYAPPAKSKSRAVWVVLAGLFTTALSLAGVYFAKVKGETNIMGWYYAYILPAGAILVGIAASSGYAFVSWKLGVKIRRGLLATILGLMLVSYFAAEYVEYGGTRYLQTGTVVQAGKTVPTYRPIGFWEYFHLKAVNWAWKKEHSTDKQGEPLGMAGYFFVLLAIAGFSYSGLIIPMAVGKKPYCDLCERYMATRTLAIWPAMLPAKKISKKDVEAKAQYERENERLLEGASGRLRQLVEYAQSNNAEAFRRETAQSSTDRKAASKLLRRLEVNLVTCPSCASGWIQPAWLAGQGKQLKRAELPKVELTQEFIRAVNQAHSLA